MSTTESPPPTAFQALAERQAAMLREMQAVGMEMIRELPARTRAEGADIQVLDLAYSRISRAIRLSMQLEARMVLDAEKAVEDARPARAPPSYPTAWERAGLDKADYDEQERVGRRRQVAYELVRKAVDAEKDWIEQDRLACELLERVDDGRDEARFVSTAPLAEVIAQICRDLRLDPTWRDFKPKHFHDLGDPGAQALIHGRYKAPTSPASAAGGGPSAEEPMVEGASREPEPFPPPDPAPDPPPDLAEAAPAYLAPPPYTGRIVTETIPPERPPRMHWMR